MILPAGRHMRLASSGAYNSSILEGRSTTLRGARGLRPCRGRCPPGGGDELTVVRPVFSESRSETTLFACARSPAQTPAAKHRDPLLLAMPPGPRDFPVRAGFVSGAHRSGTYVRSAAAVPGSAHTQSGTCRGVSKLLLDCDRPHGQ
jgi:hypothetical protein